MRRFAVLACVLGLAAPVVAEPLDEKAARKALFKSKGYSVEYATDSGLTDVQLSVIKVLEGRESKKQVSRVARYYGAIAISPSVFEKAATALLGDPESVPFQMTNGYHSPAAAAAAALRDCNAKVSAGWDECVLAAHVMPKRWKPVDFTMSYIATENFKLYRKAKAPKAFAVSTGGKGFGLAEGDDAAALALEACADRGGADDCTVVIKD